MDNRLLTDKEVKPFTQSAFVEYGNSGKIEEEHWDIGGLLKAQRDLTASSKDAEIEKLKDKHKQELSMVEGYVSMAKDAYWEGVTRIAVLSREATVTQIKDAEIEELRKRFLDYSESIPKLLREQAEAIHQECQARVDGILKEIESHGILDPREFGWWQALKEREGK